MTGDKNSKQLKFPLNEHEQIILKRYIDAERQVPEFIEKGLSKYFIFEIFLYFYYAGHGCSDHRQQIVLNEKEVKKIFWPAESKIKLICRRAGSNFKAIAVFDCCREDFVGARDRVVKALEKIKTKQLNEA